MRPGSVLEVGLPGPIQHTKVLMICHAQRRVYVRHGFSAASCGRGLPDSEPDGVTNMVLWRVTKSARVGFGDFFCGLNMRDER